MPELCNFSGLYFGATFQEAYFMFGKSKLTIPVPADIVERIIAILCEELPSPPGLILDSTVPA